MIYMKCIPTNNILHDSAYQGSEEDVLSVNSQQIYNANRAQTASWHGLMLTCNVQDIGIKCGPHARCHFHALTTPSELAVSKMRSEESTEVMWVMLSWWHSAAALSSGLWNMSRSWQMSHPSISAARLLLQRIARSATPLQHAFLARTQKKRHDSKQCRQS